MAYPKQEIVTLSLKADIIDNQVTEEEEQQQEHADEYQYCIEPCILIVIFLQAPVY
jgi:hypothetical protein